MTLIVFLLPLYPGLQVFFCPSKRALEVLSYTGWLKIEQIMFGFSMCLHKAPQISPGEFLISATTPGVLSYLWRLGLPGVTSQIFSFHLTSWGRFSSEDLRNVEVKVRFFLGEMRTPSQDSSPSLCLCHPHCSTRNCLMSKNLTRPHELLLKCK